MVLARLKPWVDVARVSALTAPPPADALAAYEEALRRRLGAARVFALSSGRAALMLGLKALGIGYGREVAVPALTCAAVADAVLALGGIPALADVSPRYFGIEAKSLKRILARGRTRAAVLAPLFGACPPEQDALAQLDAYGVPWLEDAAQSFGAYIGGRPAGARGPLAVLSTNFDKPFTTGRGGALVVNDTGLVPPVERLVLPLAPQSEAEAAAVVKGLLISDLLFRRDRYQPFTSIDLGFRYAAAEGDGYDLRSLAGAAGATAVERARRENDRLMAGPSRALLARAWRWFFPRSLVPPLGEARRLAPSLAVVGLAHLARVDEDGAQRRRLAGLFDAAFADHPFVRGPAWGGAGDEPWPIRYPAFVRDYNRRAAIMERLAAAGYEAGPFAYPRPLSGQFPYYKLSRTAGRRLRGAWRAAYGLLNLPLHDEVTEDDVAAMAGAVGT